MSDYTLLYFTYFTNGCRSNGTRRSVGLLTGGGAMLLRTLSWSGEVCTCIASSGVVGIFCVPGLDVASTTVEFCCDSVTALSSLLTSPTAGSSADSSHYGIDHTHSHYSCLHGTVVECWSFARELSLSCAPAAADGWLLMWVNHPLQVNQPGQLSFSSFPGQWMSSKLQLDVCYLGWGGAIWWMFTRWRPCAVGGWGGGVFASCLVRCTAPLVDFVNQLPLPRLYSAPGRRFLMEVMLYQVSTLYLYPFIAYKPHWLLQTTLTLQSWTD